MTNFYCQIMLFDEKNIKISKRWIMISIDLQKTCINCKKAQIFCQFFISIQGFFVLTQGYSPSGKNNIKGMIIEHKCNKFDKFSINLKQEPKMQSQQKIAVWLDCDPGLDDTFAIIYAGHASELYLLGVSTSPGNTNLANTTQNALDVLYNIGRKDVPVFAGSNSLIKGEMKLAEHMHGSNGLGGIHLPKSPQKANTERSFQQIFHRIINHDGKIIWVNTGSMTNLCILLLTYPELKQKISKIVMMGGAIGKGNITPAAEFNIFFDPSAFDQVLRLKGEIPLVMIPLEVTHENMATQDVIDHFKRNEHIPFAKAVHNMLEQFKIMYFNNYKFPFPPIHDPCTIFYILHPEEFEVSKARIEVDTFPTSYGRTNCYFCNPRSPQIDLESNNIVTTHLKNEKTKFWDEMEKILDDIFSEQVQRHIIVEEN